MISEHNEIEAKLAAEGVTLEQFAGFMNKGVYHRYEVVSGPDTYYERDDAVVRHRIDRESGRHELTVKRRKSEKSTRDREEIDLHFGKKTAPKDVDAFLKAVGFVPVFVLVKVAYIYHVVDDMVPLTIVYYHVWKQDTTEYTLPPPGIVFTPPDDARTFIEVEAEKGSAARKKDAKALVEGWVRDIRDHMLVEHNITIGEALNDSLYELYSGKRYQTV
jgi:hypothetical protein